MKWTIIALFALGLVAAVSASVLVATLQSSEKPAPAAAPWVAPDVSTASTEPPALAPGATSEPLVPAANVLVAARDLEPMTVLDTEAVEVKSVPASLAPAGALSDPIQAIGKVLLAPMKAGQAFAPDSFASERSGVRLASALSPGMRAVSITLADASGVERLLYPGCVVDVLATIRLRGPEGQSERTSSFTLLQSVFVLAVGSRTIVSQPAGGEAAPFAPAMGAEPTVTLLVDPKQAERLALAGKEGSLSLALRNPKDNTPVHSDETRLETPLWTSVIVRGGVAETKTFAISGSGASGGSTGGR